MPTIAIGIGKGPAGYSARVPVDSLAQDGVPPEEGDDVSFSLDGTVQDVSGNTATIKVTAINGEPVSGAGEEGEEESGGAGQGPSGPASGADGIGRPLGAAPLRPANRMMTATGAPATAAARNPLGATMMPTGETLAQMGARLRKGARGRAI